MRAARPQRPGLGGIRRGAQRRRRAARSARPSCPARRAGGEADFRAGAYPPPRSGGGGPCETWWRGLRPIRIIPNRRRPPSTALRAVPLPRFRGGGKLRPFQFASQIAQRTFNMRRAELGGFVGFAGGPGGVERVVLADRAGVAAARLEMLDDIALGGDLQPLEDEERDAAARGAGQRHVEGAVQRRDRGGAIL